ncbi:hypothetical protein [Methanolacinia paynteri]|uniref:hypothetical protein n=1 Tax=Methanolacinia paynteri TaxID=230356 RepID=UPI00064F05A6|nr:hypothetical protein [Methanolacinia paynteri]
MDLAINQDLLSKITIAIVIGIVIVGAIIGLKVAGFLGGDESGSITSGPNSLSTATESSSTIRTQNSSQSTNEDSDEKVVDFNWTYKDKQFSLSFTIENSTYNSFKAKRAGSVPGEETGDVITEYIVTDGDGRLVRGLSNYILEQSVENGWGDYDTIMNTIACIEQFGPGDFENTANDGSYRYPLETVWEGKGDREDMSILAASILDQMGYPVAIMVYPDQYDRGQMIWEYPAIGIRCEEGTDGKTYTVLRSVPAGNVNCYIQAGTFNIPSMQSFKPKYGYFEGNGTVEYSDGQTAAAGEVSWNIPAATLETPENFTSRPGMVPVLCRIENASWVAGDSYVYIDVLNSSVLPGEIPGELSKTEPEIFDTLIDPENDITITRDDEIDSTMTPLLRRPSPLEDISDTEFKAGISEVLGLPPGPVGLVDEISEANNALEDEYWEDVWYDTNVNYYDQTWYLNVINYEIAEPTLLYTKSNEIYISPPSAWRIECVARPVDPPDRDLDEISSFSDIRIAVFRVDEDNGTATLAGEMSYGYKTGQENVKYLPFYETGNFYIAVFVRNCEAEISIQVHGSGAA